MPRTNRRAATRRAALTSAALLVTGLAATGTAGAASSNALGAPTAVPQGNNPALSAKAVAEGTTTASTPVQVSFVMKARNLAALEAKVTAGWKGAYLTPAQFAATYGQAPAIIAELTSYLASYGITSTVLANNLDVETSGTAGDYNKALDIGLQNYSVPAASGKGTQQVHASKADPKLPANVANGILSILGLSNYAPFVSRAQPAAPHAVAPAATAPGAAPAVAAAPAASGTIPSGERTPLDFASTYGLTPVEAAGAHGQGQTIGIVTLATVNPGVPQTFWSKYLHLPTSSNRLTAVNVDGGAGAPSLTAGSDETDLDAEQSGAIADQAQVRVYQAPNTDNGFADAFFTAAAEDVAGSVSASWGESETYLQEAQANGTTSHTYQQAYDEAFLELEAQGQPTFASSGDAGAYDATADAATTDLTVDLPGASPYLTSAGGTTLPGTQTYPVLAADGAPTAATESVTIPTERAWSWNYDWPLYRTQLNATGTPFRSRPNAAKNLVVGDGGGYSTIEPRPSYQQGVSGVASFNVYPYLTPTTVSSAGGLPEPTAFSYTPTPTLTSGSAPSGRAEPDLSYDADPQTGYALYDPQFKAVYGSDIEEFGGTSFTAPQLNGASAVIASAVGHRVGFWNPTIYRAAASTSSPFNALQNTQVYGSKYFFQTSATGVTSGLPGQFTNDDNYYTGNPGAVYNPATGLGVGNLAGLAAVFAKG